MHDVVILCLRLRVHMKCVEAALYDYINTAHGTSALIQDWIAHYGFANCPAYSDLPTTTLLQYHARAIIRVTPRIPSITFTTASTPTCYHYC